MSRLLPLLVSLFLSVVPAKADWPVKSMNKAIDQTNFVVNNGCSGTLIDLKERYILTAAHCVERQYETLERELISNEGVVTKEKYRKLREGFVTQLDFVDSSQVRQVSYVVALKAVDKDNDLAVVQIKAPTIPNTMAAKLADDEPARGDKVYVVGNPMSVLYSNVTMGIVSSLDRTYNSIGLDGDKPLMQISAGVVGGNSGGAVYNSEGELVGVPVLAHRNNEILGFAVPLNVIKKFLVDNRLEKKAD